MSIQNGLIIKEGNKFQGFLFDEVLSKEIVESSRVHLFGQEYVNQGTCCEWLEVREKVTRRLVGLVFTDFYEFFISVRQQELLPGPLDSIHFVVDIMPGMDVGSWHGNY